MTTEDGTVATEVSDDARLTLTPPSGACAEIVTVPVDVPPSATVVGEIVKLVSFGWLTVPIWICHIPLPYVPALR